MPVLSLTSEFTLLEGNLKDLFHAHCVLSSHVKYFAIKICLGKYSSFLQSLHFSIMMNNTKQKKKKKGINSICIVG